MTRTTNVRVQFGGEAHAGWLPAGASVPPETRSISVQLEVKLEHDGHGYRLSWVPSPNEVVDPKPPYAGDLWFHNEDSAIQSARENFGVHW
jgi:hypothetical protein